MGIKDRIRRIIDNDCKRSNAVFAERINIVPSTIQKWDDQHLPNGDTLQRIHKEFNVDINWLLTGVGERHTKNYIIEGDSDTPLVNERLAEYSADIPRLGQAVDMLITILESHNESFIQPVMSSLITFSEAANAARRQNQQLSAFVSELNEIRKRLAVVEQKLQEEGEVEKEENTEKKAM